NFETQGQNIEPVYYDRAVNVARGLFNPGAVFALPEALLIADSGDTAKLSVLTGLWQPVPGDTGNSRVLLLKGPGFPAPAADVDMAAPADMAAQEMVMDEQPSGCDCDLGHGRGAGF